MLSWKDVYNHIKSFYNPFSRVLLACSGGPDSMLLFYLFNALKKEWPHFVFEVFILNHLIEGNEQFAYESSHFVIRCCDDAKVACHAYSEKVSLYQLKEKISSEQAGRKLRYEYLHLLKDSRNLDIITTAHHKDDQLETILMRLFKGTGVEGFLAIKERTPILVRPLLAFLKQDIISILQKENLPYFIDPTNKENDYLRNKVRNLLSPLLEEIFGADYKEKVLQFRKIVEEQQLSLEHFLPSWKKDIPFGVSLSLKELFRFEPISYKNIVLSGLKRVTNSFFIPFKQLEQVKDYLQNLKKTPIYEHKTIYHKGFMSLILSYQNLFWIDKRKYENFFHHLKLEQDENKGYNYGKMHVCFGDKGYIIKEIKKSDILHFKPSKRVGDFFKEKKVHFFLRDFYKGIFDKEKLIGLLDPFNQAHFIKKDNCSSIFLSEKSLSLDP
jgi:tRNA(Ile)-lysidine synthase